jgi:hypothetical protein
MRRAVLFIALLLAAAASATPYTSNFSESQTCTTGTCARAAAPTTNAEGMSLYMVTGYRLSICAAIGQTLSGAGTMQAYWCDSLSALCMRSPQLDQSVTASGVQCQAFPDFIASFVTYLADSVVFAASGVTVSGGSALTVRLYPTVLR